MTSDERPDSSPARLESAANGTGVNESGTIPGMLHAYTPTIEPGTLLLPADSPFRHIPAKMDPAQAIAFDGLRYAFDMLAVGYGRLRQQLMVLSQTDEQGPSPHAVAAAFLDAWSIIDGMWRLHQLLCCTPRLRGTPQLEAHRRALKEVEELRHGLQHLSKQLRICAEAALPLWGSLSWYWIPDAPDSGGISFTLISGAALPRESGVLDPRGRQLEVPIGLVTLSAFGFRIEISELMRRVERLAHQLDRGLRSAVGDGPTLGTDLLLALSIKFHPTDDGATESVKDGAPMLGS